MTDASRLTISLAKMREVDVPKLMKQMRKRRAQFMSVAEARRHFSDEEIRWIQIHALVEHSRRRRILRRFRFFRQFAWEPPMILRGDYDETFGIYSPKRPIINP